MTASYVVRTSCAVKPSGLSCDILAVKKMEGRKIGKGVRESGQVDTDPPEFKYLSGQHRQLGTFGIRAKQTSVDSSHPETIMDTSGYEGT